MSRVLVTGATGFIGRRSLAFLVERGHEVHAVARGAVAPAAGIVPHACDLLDHRATSALIGAVRPSHLLHFAWYAVPGRFWSAPENLDWVAASLHLLRAFADAGGRRAVCAGSCAEYGWSQPVLSETATNLAASTLYGTAKNALRACLEQAAGPLGIDWAWGRIFWLYGPGEPPGRLVSDVIGGLLAGKRVAVSEGRQQRDFLHVDDVARAFADLVGSDCTGAINIASGAPVAVRDLLQQLGGLMDRASLIDFGARATAPNEPLSLAADVARLTRQVGFTPRYDLAEGLRHTIAWWQQQARG